MLRARVVPEGRQPYGARSWLGRASLPGPLPPRRRPCAQPPMTASFSTVASEAPASLQPEQTKKNPIQAFNDWWKLEGKDKDDKLPEPGKLSSLLTKLGQLVAPDKGLVAIGLVCMVRPIRCICHEQTVLAGSLPAQVRGGRRTAMRQCRHDVGVTKHLRKPPCPSFRVSIT